MRCKHCGFGNGEDEHRCLRCGRRMKGVAVAAPPAYSGANALAPSVMMSSDDTTEFPPTRQAGPTQPRLFAYPGLNVIPFDRRERTPVPGAVAPQAIQGSHARVSARKSSAAPPDLQGRLDFIPATPLKGRTLKTSVEAQVFCDQPVATPTHRMVASAIDGVIILAGFGLLVTLFRVLGGSFGAGKALWLGLSAVLGLVSMLYGLIWAIAGRETAGMRLTDLQLITFDGFHVDPRSRALRFASTWLSFCSGGLGILWAVADEENLTWHDHISKTFPTIREVPGTFVKQRR
jgi:uncharacterized RDD family membrane protein YckC